MVTQSLSITLGDTTANASGFSVYGQLTNGSTSSKCRLNITNNTSSDYVASSGRPYARYRWRAKDGSYTGQWSGNILMPSCTNIPKSFTRNDVVDAGNPRLMVMLLNGMLIIKLLYIKHWIQYTQAMGMERQLRSVCVYSVLLINAELAWVFRCYCCSPSLEIWNIFP